jgi:hypothetical protein
MTNPRKDVWQLGALRITTAQARMQLAPRSRIREASQ